MRRFLAVLIVASVLILPLPGSNAQRRSVRPRKPAATKAVSISTKGVERITADQIKEYLYYIASDEMEGRDTPSRGLDNAAKFLASKLAQWRLKPAGDEGTYFQKIALRRDLIDQAQSVVVLNGQTQAFGSDYIPFAKSVDVTSQIVFAGNGWFVKSKNIDAYKGIDAKGKIAVIFGPVNAFPRGIGPSDLTGKNGEDWMSPGEYAIKQGVAALVVVPDVHFVNNWERNRRRMTERGSTLVEKLHIARGPQIPGIIASHKLAELLLQGEQPNSAALFEAATAGEMPAPFAMNSQKQLRIKVEEVKDPIWTQNVVALFEGSDPVLKQEYVALGAHYDHVGVVGQGDGDRIYNGADDDGSGTTALLAIAEALAKTPTRPKRSILFVWHSGEEKGLWGSRYFVEYPTVRLDKIVAQINIDMIGRSKKEGDTNPRNRSLTGPHEIYVIGSRMMSTELGDLVESVNKGYLNLSYNYLYDNPADPNRFFYRSDHYHYARKGIPIVFFFDGEHEDYHQPTDSPDKIDYQKMEKVTRTVFMTMLEIANRPVRLKVDKPMPEVMINVN